MRWPCLLVLCATVSTAAAQPVPPDATVRLELSDGRLVEGRLVSHHGTAVAWIDDDGARQQGTAYRAWVRRGRAGAWATRGAVGTGIAGFIGGGILGWYVLRLACECNDPDNGEAFKFVMIGGLSAAVVTGGVGAIIGGLLGLASPAWDELRFGGETGAAAPRPPGRPGSSALIAVQAGPGLTADGAFRLSGGARGSLLALVGAAGHEWLAIGAAVDVERVLYDDGLPRVLWAVLAADLRLLISRGGLRGYLDLSGGISTSLTPEARIAGAFELARSARTAFAVEAAYSTALGGEYPRVELNLGFVQYR